jgi:Kef-type K+ transport system membrane component KefB
MPLIEALLLLLVSSRVLGEVASRFGQPPMIGEIAAGILLGPSVLGYVHFSPEIKAIADLGVLLLVLLAGMEMDMDALWASFRGRGAWVSAAGFVVPLGFGMVVAKAFGLDRTRIIFIGLCIAITAVPVSIRILMDLGKLQTDIGRKIISAAVANDVASLLALGIILNVKGGGGTAKDLLVSITLALFKAVVFMVAVAVAARLIKRYSPSRFLISRSVVDRMLDKLKGKESLFALVLLFVIGFASFSAVLGLDFVVGAFFGSMLLSHQLLGQANFQEIQKTASNMTMGFLGPIFFAVIGLEFDASSLRNWSFVLAILAASFAGKILGGYIGGRLARLRSDQSWALGIGLNGRGIMELVIANIALANGFIGQQLFTVLVLMAVVTTFATPFLLKGAYGWISQVEARSEGERVPNAL